MRFKSFRFILCLSFFYFFFCPSVSFGYDYVFGGAQPFYEPVAENYNIIRQCVDATDYNCAGPADNSTVQSDEVCTYQIYQGDGIYGVRFVYGRLTPEADPYCSICRQYDYIPNGAVPDSCYNHVQDDGECGIDRGGVCGGECPAEWYCSNGVQDTNEEGIDCGGSCSAPCVKNCPDGYVAMQTEDGEMCLLLADSGPGGTCPAGYSATPAGDPSDPTTVCIAFDPDLANVVNEDGSPAWIAPVYSADGSEPENWSEEGSVPSPDPWIPPELGLEIVEVNGDAVDNGDGTSTVTDTKTTTATTTKADGTTVTTTRDEQTVTIVDNTTGKVLSSGTTVNETGNPEDDITNYDLSALKLPTDTEYPGFKDSDAPEKKGIISTITGYLNQLPIMTALDDLEVKTTSTDSDCDISLGTYLGRNLKIDLCRWRDYLTPLGTLMVISAHILAVFVVVGYKKSGGSQ